MKAYFCTIDLSIGDTTPGFVISWANGTLPANSVPTLAINDSITFQFTGRVVTSCVLHARPLATSETMSPFAATAGGTSPPNGEIDLLANPPASNTIYVVTLNGNWNFSLVGAYQATNTYGQPPFVVPFFMDPDADVGSGNPV